MVPCGAGHKQRTGESGTPASISTARVLLNWAHAILKFKSVTWIFFPSLARPEGRLHFTANRHIRSKLPHEHNIECCLIHIIYLNLFGCEHRRSMTGQMYDFPRAHKLQRGGGREGHRIPRRPVQRRQQCPMSCVSTGGSKVHGYSKCKVTTTPAPGDLML